MSAPEPAPRASLRRFPARWPAGAFALLAVSAALLALAGAPTGVRAAAAAPVFLAGAAFPLLVAGSPPEPSALKLGLLAWLLSPCVLAALYALARVFLPAAEAAAACLLAAAALQPLAWRHELRFDPPGRAACLALAGAAAMGALVGGLHLALPVLRQMGDGLWQAGGIAATARELGPANPWLAGSPLHGPAAYWVLGDLAQQFFRLAPTGAPALLAAWAAAALPPALYFLAAPLWAEPRRVALSVGLALAGWNAAGGWLWWARGAPGGPVEDVDGWLRRAEGGLPAGAPGLPLFGSAELVLPGPFPVALALAAGAWMCAAHALRHARRPWVELCALLHGLALLADPGVGLAALAATGAAALAVPGRAIVRPAVSLGLLLASLPGLWALRAAAGAGPVLGELANPSWASAGVLTGLLAAGAALLLVPGPPGPRPEGWRSVAALVAAGAILPLLFGVLVRLPGALPGGALRLAGLALGLACAGGLARAWERGGLARAAAVGSGLALAGGGLGAWTLGLSAHLALAGIDPGIREAPLAVGPRVRALPPDLRVLESAAGEPAELALGPDTAAAYRWLSAELGAPWRRSILLLSEARELERLPQAPRPHPAGLFAGLDLWADRSEPSARAHPRLQARVRAARELFERKPYAGPALTHELEALGRPAILLVGPRERAGGAGLEAELERLGFRLLHEAGEERVWGWTPARP